jgi:hypothetical protein
VAVRGAKGPLEARHVERHAEARADRILGNPAGKVSGPHAGGKNEPRCGLELVIDEKCGQPSGRILGR